MQLVISALRDGHTHARTHTCTRTHVRMHTHTHTHTNTTDKSNFKKLGVCRLVCSQFKNATITFRSVIMVLPFSSV